MCVCVLFFLSLSCAVLQLRRRCKELQLDRTGNRDDLLARLELHLRPRNTSGSAANAPPSRAAPSRAAPTRMQAAPAAPPAVHVFEGFENCPVAGTT